MNDRKNSREVFIIDLAASNCQVFGCVSGMTHLQLVKVQPQVFTAKCSEPQVESSNAGMKEGASETSEPTHRNLMRLNGG